MIFNQIYKFLNLRHSTIHISRRLLIFYLPTSKHFHFITSNSTSDSHLLCFLRRLQMLWRL